MKYYVIDAFTNKIFKGNPAGVCILDKELPDEIMQNIASENNLSETAFLLKKGDKNYLRWFTPKVEVDLCGHATLATAYVLLTFIEPYFTEVSFETKSGPLFVKRQDELLIMNFPSWEPKIIAIPTMLGKALSTKIMETHLSRDLLVLLEHESDVKNLIPNISLLKRTTSGIALAIMVTAPGDECDFVSRVFAPNAGIDEDPVTGSTHSTLIPFWSKRLKKNNMIAKQLSERGGILYCEYLGERVNIGGKAACYLQGNINI